MTVLEISQFRTEFKKIVYRKADLEKSNQYIRKLHNFDKNGSHENAIKKALEQREEIKSELKKMLKGKDYDDWKEMSKRISAVNSKLVNANKALSTAQNNLEKLSFPL